MNITQSNNLTILSLRGIYTIFLIVIRFFRGIATSRKLINEYKPDIFFINEYVLVQFAIEAGLKKIPTITYVRSQFFKGRFGFWDNIIKRLIANTTDKIIGISKQEVNQFFPLVNNTPNKFIIVREYLSKKDFSIEGEQSFLKQKYMIPEDKLLILMLGGVNKIKGTFELLKAINELSKKGEKIFCLIVGKIGRNGIEQRSYTQKCMDFIQEHNIEQTVKIIEEMKDVGEILTVCDILVSSNTTSHFSRPVIEAWAKKKAIIATDFPHSREIIDDYENGLLYKSGDDKALAEAIISLISDEHLYNKIAANGYNKALELFDAEKNTKQIVDICDELIGDD